MCFFQLDVVQAIAEILPTGGPPADVILKDIKAGEAILHVISGVLIPSTKVRSSYTCTLMHLRVVADSKLPNERSIDEVDEELCQHAQLHGTPGSSCQSVDVRLTVLSLLSSLRGLSGLIAGIKLSLGKPA